MWGWGVVSGVVWSVGMISGMVSVVVASYVGVR